MRQYYIVSYYMNLDDLSNYTKLENGVIKQKNVNKIEYNYEYSNKYNNYGEKSNYLSYLILVFSKVSLTRIW